MLARMDGRAEVEKVIDVGFEVIEKLFVEVKR
jgi:hypothetical protein